MSGWLKSIVKHRILHLGKKVSSAQNRWTDCNNPCIICVFCARSCLLGITMIAPANFLVALIFLIVINSTCWIIIIIIINDNVYGAILMTMVTARVTERRVAANPQTKPTDLGCESAYVSALVNTLLWQLYYKVNSTYKTKQHTVQHLVQWNNQLLHYYLAPAQNKVMY